MKDGRISEKDKFWTLRDVGGEIKHMLNTHIFLQPNSF